MEEVDSPNKKIRFIDKCAICRNELDSKCIECQENDLDKTCESIQGLCNHEFHIHCWMRWKKSKSNICPICNKKFEDKPDVCAICLNDADKKCIGCESSQECHKVMGKCNHIFHEHCIIQWINVGNESCPVCRGEFETVDKSSKVNMMQIELQIQKKFLKKLLGDLIEYMLPHVNDRDLLLKIINQGEACPHKPLIFNVKLKSLNEFCKNPLKHVGQTNVKLEKKILEKTINETINHLLNKDKDLDHIRNLLKISFGEFKDLTTDKFEKYLSVMKQLLNLPISNEIQWIDLTWLDLSRYKFNNIIYGHMTDLSHSNLSNSVFQGSPHLHGIFKFTNLENTKFIDVCMKTSKFENCNLKNAEFNNCWLSHCEFKSCNLIGACVYREGKAYTGKKLKDILEDYYNSKIHNCEFEEEKDKMICTICLDRKIDTVILPCGHCSCVVCILRILERNPKCPFCKYKIKNYQKLYF